MQYYWRPIGALLFLLIAGMIAFRSLWVSRSAQEAKRIVLVNADTAALSAALFSPIEDLGGVDAFIESLRPRLEQAATEAGAPTGSERAYVDIVCARLHMLLARDYQAYRSNFHSLTGKMPDDVAGIFDESGWLSLCGYFTSAPVSDDATAVRRVVIDMRHERPLVKQGKPAGRFAAIYAPGAYTDLLPRRREHEAFEAYIPMIVAERDIPEMNSGGKSHRCFLVLGFAWDERTRRWIPFRAGVNDPSNAANGVLPTPWI